MTKSKEKILIVEDEFLLASDLEIFLHSSGYNVLGIATSVTEAKALIKAEKPDWVLLDIILKGNETGIDLAIELIKYNIPFLFVSANTDQDTLEKVKKTQPYGFIIKPFRKRDLLVMLEIARYRYSIENCMKTLPHSKEKQSAISTDIVGNSPIINEILKKISMVAETDTAVLITGESGTGKERIAHAIHENSARKNKPLVVVNCAALSLSLIEAELFGFEKGAFTGANSQRIGKFEQASGGTIFLDEIGELPAEAQVKLLRVLQEKEIDRIGGDKVIKVDVRIIAATNRNLEQEVAEGRFRLDLYYRLNVFPIEAPPLRDRKEDISVLAHYFLKKVCKKTNKNVTGISPKVIEQLQLYKWPGNVRELEHLIERSALFATSDTLTEVHIPSTIVHSSSAENHEIIQSLENMERNHILHALKVCCGKITGPSGAAEMLKISSTTLYSKMKKLGIQQEFYY